MKELLAKRLQLKAEYNQISSQILSLRDQQKELSAAFLAINEIIEGLEKAKQEESKENGQ